MIKKGDKMYWLWLRDWQVDVLAQT